MINCILVLSRTEGILGYKRRRCACVKHKDHEGYESVLLQERFSESSVLIVMEFKSQQWTTTLEYLGTVLLHVSLEHESPCDNRILVKLQAWLKLDVTAALSYYAQYTLSQLTASFGHILCFDVRFIMSQYESYLGITPSGCRAESVSKITLNHHEPS
jgi:hypothetical protein